MRYIIFLFLLVVCSCNYLIKPKSKIVDNVFAEAIRRQCPACIDNKNYLTKHADTLTILNVSRGFSINEEQPVITSLEGFRFNNLEEFSCFNNEITELPDNLPTGLIMLDCGINKISTLPDISFNRLEFLFCFNNQISQIPQGYFPNTLKRLVCSDNKIVALPEKLPDSLNFLYCDNNQLTSLPKNLPNSLESFSYDGNPIIDSSKWLLQ